ncbi:MAG: flagellar biosynthetic protein FliO [Myxococcales bacterium]|nr:flagellar biosynthetic protein FliO [Myxococcales bacterium]MDP3502975.1 flagellar biosynthetic protein FliO [Myxococcales bacterium]
MHALLVSLLLVATPSTAEEGSAAAVTPPPAPPSAADSVVAAAFQHTSIGTKSADVQAPVSSNWSSFAAPGFALAALAALAFALTRRRAKSTRSISVVETASLGPKRSLVIADVMGERMVLGVSEAGISVLSTRAAPQPEPAPFVIPPPLETVSASLSKEMSFFDRVLGRVPQPNAVASFDETLRDSLEDQELRAKLSLGQRSVVP